MVRLPPSSGKAKTPSSSFVSFHGNVISNRSPSMPVRGHVRNVRSSWEKKANAPDLYPSGPDEKKLLVTNRLRGGNIGKIKVPSRYQQGAGEAAVVESGIPCDGSAEGGSGDGDAIKIPSSESGDHARKRASLAPTAPTSPKEVLPSPKRRFDSPTWESPQNKKSRQRDDDSLPRNENAARVGDAIHGFGEINSGGGKRDSANVKSSNSGVFVLSKTIGSSNNGNGLPTTKKSGRYNPSEVSKPLGDTADIVTTSSGARGTGSDRSHRIIDDQKQEQHLQASRFKNSDLHPLSLKVETSNEVPTRALTDIQASSAMEKASTGIDERTKIVQCFSSDSGGSGGSSYFNWSLGKQPEEGEVKVADYEDEVFISRNKRTQDIATDATPIAMANRRGPFVDKQNDQQHQQKRPPQGDISDEDSAMSSASSKASSASSETKSAISLACPSSDSTSSSLMYSLVTAHSLDNTLQLASPSHDDSINDAKESNNNGTDNLVGSNSVEGEEDPVTDLVAATLAECHLLLEMGPPATPAENPRMKNPMELSGGDLVQKHHHQSIKRAQAMQTVRLQQTNASLQPQPHGQPLFRTQPKDTATLEQPSISGVSSTTMNTIASLSSISKSLTCPACTNEFDDGDEKEGGFSRQPLHSFACDHIICHACVFACVSNDACDSRCTMVTGSVRPISSLVACPECGKQGAFDTDQPVVSRAYLSLVRRIRKEVLLASSEKWQLQHSNSMNIMQQAERVPIANTDNVNSSNDNNAVPSQITVPSPTSSHRHAGDAHGNAMSNDAASDFPPARVGSAVSKSSKSRVSQRLPTTLIIDVGTPTAGTNDSNANSNHSAQNDRENDEQDQQGITTSTTNSMVNGSGNDSNVNEEKHEEQGIFSVLVEPATPVSRAEHRFLQRKQTLAKSLEKVNRILERSRAYKANGNNNKALEEKEGDGSNNSNNGGVSAFENGIKDGDDGDDVNDYNGDVSATSMRKQNDVADDEANNFVMESNEDLNGVHEQSSDNTTSKEEHLVEQTRHFEDPMCEDCGQSKEEEELGEEEIAQSLEKVNRILERGKAFKANENNNKSLEEEERANRDNSDNAGVGVIEHDVKDVSGDDYFNDCNRDSSVVHTRKQDDVADDVVNNFNVESNENLDDEHEESSNAMASKEEHLAGQTRCFEDPMCENCERSREGEGLREDEEQHKTSSMVSRLKTELTINTGEDASSQPSLLRLAQISMRKRAAATKKPAASPAHDVPQPQHLDEEADFFSNSSIGDDEPIFPEKTSHKKEEIDMIYNQDAVGTPPSIGTAVNATKDIFRINSCSFHEDLEDNGDTLPFIDFDTSVDTQMITEPMSNGHSLFVPDKKDTSFSIAGNRATRQNPIAQQAYVQDVAQLQHREEAKDFFRNSSIGDDELSLPERISFNKEETDVIYNQDAAGFPPSIETPENATWDIFRISNYSFHEDQDNNGDTLPFIHFGTSVGTQMITDSLFAPGEDDTLFLIAGNRTTRQKPIAVNSTKPLRSKIQGYCANIKVSLEKQPKLQPSSVNDQYQQQQQKPIQPQSCPQFLPSLEYSTMQDESNEVAGLVMPDEEPPRSPMRSAKMAASAKKSKRPRKGRTISGRSFYTHLKSFNQVAQPDEMVHNGDNKGSRLEFLQGSQQWEHGFTTNLPSPPKENGKLVPQRVWRGPTYDFSVHSCSLSPSSYNGGQGGGALQALVTHKPRGSHIHKKLLKKFRCINKKGRTSFS